MERSVCGAYSIPESLVMIFTPTNLSGAYLIRPEHIRDERGFFLRTWCKQEFQEHGLDVDLVQCNVSYNRRKGTVRGMHFQESPYGEVKIVRCVRGAIYDVIVDLRPESPTFKNHVAVELSATNADMLYVPQGFAHGFQTLENHSEVSYFMGSEYVPEAARGVRWDDPAFGIKWPIKSSITISEKDRNYSNYD